MALPLVEQLFAASAGDRQACFDAACQYFDAPQVAITELVLALGPHLTNSDDAIRIRACEILAEVLTKCTKLSLPSHAAKHLIEFFSERLQDVIAIPYVIKALAAIFRLHRASIPAGSCAAMLAALFQHVQIQSLVLVGRRESFELISIGLEHYANEIQETMGVDNFITGFLSAVDSERDPRNLLVIFGMTQRIFALFDGKLGRWTAEVFDSVSCYFPITFTPPKNDTIGITAADLKTAMHSVLTCTASLGSFTFNFLLEKLQSSIVQTKIDCMEVISLFVNKHGLQKIAVFIDEIWDSLRREVLHSTSTGSMEQVTSDEDIDDVEVDALKCIRVLLTAADRDVQQAPPASSQCQNCSCAATPAQTMTELLDRIVTEAGRELRVPDSALARQYAKIVIVACLSSASAFAFIVSRVWPSLQMKFESANAMSQQRLAVMSLLNQILIGLLTTDVSNHPIREYLAQWRQFMQDGLSTNSECKYVAVKALTNLIQIDKNINSNGSLFDSSQITELAVTSLDVSLSQDSYPHSCGLFALNSLLHSHADVVIPVIVPSLLSKLHVFVDNHYPLSQVAKAITISLSMDMDVFRVFQAHTLRYLSALDSANCSQALTFLTELLDSILKSVESPHILRQAKLNAKPCALSSSNELVLEIIPVLFELCQRQSQFLSDSVPIFQCLVRKMSVDLQTQLLKSCCAMWFDGVAQFSWTNQCEAVISDYIVNNEMLELFCVILQNLHSDVTLTRASLIASCLHNEIRQSVSERRLQPAILALSSLINKQRAAKSNVEFAQDAWIVENVINPLKNTALSASEAEFAIWVCKALYMCGDSLASALMDAVFNALTSCQSVELALKLSSVFAIVPSSQTLSAESHMIQVTQFKTTFFDFSLERLLQLCHSTTVAVHVRMSALLGLAQLIDCVPASLVEPRIAELIPLLVLSLDLQTEHSEALQTATVNTILAWIEQAPQQFAEHLSTLLPVLLKLSANASKMALRARALNCICQLAVAMPFRLLAPHRAHVITVLSASIIDRKRSVRQAAVAARNAWFVSDMNV